MKTTITRAMMVALITIASVTGFAQEKTENLSKKEFGPLTCIHSKVTDLDKGKVYKYVGVFFVDQRYPSLNKHESVFFDATTMQESIMQLIKDLKTAHGEMGSKATLSWKRGRYNIRLYDFTGDLYLADDENRAYTKLDSGEVKKLIEWLESLNL